MQSLNGPGKIAFREDEIADVNCSTDAKGQVWVKHAIGHPDWNPIILAHPKGPYQLVMNDGRTAQVLFQNLQGLVEVVEPRLP